MPAVQGDARAWTSRSPPGTTCRGCSTRRSTSTRSSARPGWSGSASATRARGDAAQAPRRACDERDRRLAGAIADAGRRARAGPRRPGRRRPDRPVSTEARTRRRRHGRRLAGRARRRRVRARRRAQAAAASTGCARDLAHALRARARHPGAARAPAHRAAVRRRRHRRRPAVPGDGIRRRAADRPTTATSAGSTSRRGCGCSRRCWTRSSTRTPTS